MKKFKAFTITIIVALMCAFSITAYAAPSNGEILSQAEQNVQPIETMPTDAPIQPYKNSSFSSKDYMLFYTQTTLLALVAGYLVLFKAKGITKTEKRRRSLKS